MTFDMPTSIAAVASFNHHVPTGNKMNRQ
jgi:hypothetical protein